MKPKLSIHLSSHYLKAPKMTVHDAVLLALNTRWMTIPEMTKFVNSKTKGNLSESNVGARIRDCRKKQYGGHEVTCRYLPVVKRWEYGIAA